MKYPFSQWLPLLHKINAGRKLTQILQNRVNFLRVKFHAIVLPIVFDCSFRYLIGEKKPGLKIVGGNY